MDKINFEITERIGVIGERQGWKRELNKVSWDGRTPKYDIREWDEDHIKMSKGITMTEEQVEALYKLLKERFEK